MNESVFESAIKYKKPWYEYKELVVLLLILFFPIGLYGIWKNSQFSKKTKWIVTGLFGFFVLASAGHNNKTMEQSKKQTSQANSVPTQSVKGAEKTISDISFFDVRNKMLNTMTDIQFEELAKSLKGKRVHWRGWVEDVSEKVFGGYEVWVDMDTPNNSLSVQDISFSVSREKALSLKKNQLIEFEGDIEQVMNIVGSLQVTLEKVVIPII